MIKGSAGGLLVVAVALLVVAFIAWWAGGSHATEPSIQYATAAPW